MTRAPALPRAVAVRMEARKALEAYAAKVLDPDTVMVAIGKVTMDGFCHLALRFEKPLPLQDTEAARKLAVILKNEGFELEWVARLVLARENITGADLMTADLLIRW